MRAAGPRSLGEPLLTADQVAAFLQVDRATVYRWAGAPHGLPVVELPGRVRRFRRADLEAFLEQRLRASESSFGRSQRLLGRSR